MGLSKELDKDVWPGVISLGLLVHVGDAMY